MANAAREHAPGAVPPSGGVPPRSGAAPSTEVDERSAADDLADGLELLRRAARKTLRSVDPRIEALAERAVTALRQLEDEAQEDEALEELWARPDVHEAAQEAGREIAGALERVATRVDALLARRPGRPRVG